MTHDFEWVAMFSRENDTIVVHADGYTEGRVLSHWEPFKHERQISFKVKFIGDNDFYLEHPTYYLRESENNLEFWKEGGYWHCRAEIGAAFEN